MQLALTESTGNQRGLPFFRDPVIYDAQLASRILNQHHALVSPSESLAAETHLLSALSDLITRHRPPCAGVSRVTCDDTRHDPVGW